MALQFPHQQLLLKKLFLQPRVLISPLSEVFLRSYSSKKDSDTVKNNPIVSEFIAKKWGGTSQKWPTDRPLEAVVEPTEQLQSHWASLERRVLGRKSRKDGPRGRINIRKSEEVSW